MKPTSFPEQNCVIAKNQPPYLPLPAFKDQDGIIVTCWKLSWAERLRLLILGRLWMSVMTFNTPLQPQKPTTICPLKRLFT